MTTLAECIIAISRSLRDADVSHAFGGALALAFHVEEPRTTRDIDINIFVTTDRAQQALRALPPQVQCSEAQLHELNTAGQSRLFWGDTPIDVFLSNHAFHDEAARHVVEVPFLGEQITVLGATELVVFKAFFNRTKDWADIETMVEVSSFDAHRALGWLVDLLGNDDRVDRLRRLMHSD